jgi:hypothetical protein
VSFAAITLNIASERLFVVDFIIDSVRELLDTPSYTFNLFFGHLWHHLPFGPY